MGKIIDTGWYKIVCFEFDTEGVHLLPLSPNDELEKNGEIEEMVSTIVYEVFSESFYLLCLVKDGRAAWKHNWPWRFQFTKDNKIMTIDAQVFHKAVLYRKIAFKEKKYNLSIRKIPNLDANNFLHNELPEIKGSSLPLSKEIQNLVFKDVYQYVYNKDLQFKDLLFKEYDIANKLLFSLKKIRSNARNFITN